MNCLCNPPRLTVIKKTQKEGSNLGKEFFSCSINGGCNFFCWVGEKMPAPYQRNQSQIQKSPKKALGSSIAVRLSVIGFEDNPVRVWFAASHAACSKLFDFYNSIPSVQKRYDDKVRNWNFDFTIYDQYVNQLQATKFSFIELEELPRFLIQGIKKYIAKANEREVLQKDEDGNVVVNVRMERSLADQLLDYQLVGIKFVIGHGGKALIGDEMVVFMTISPIFYSK